MNWFRFSGLLVLAVYLILASGCAIKPAAPDRVSQRAALERWSQCLERFGTQYAGSLHAIRDTARSACDGHRRDVLATFPAHLENQVDTILSERTRVFTARLVKTGLGNSSLSEARQDDL